MGQGENKEKEERKKGRKARKRDNGWEKKTNNKNEEFWKGRKK